MIPEMYEYERTETTVVNSYVRPIVARYMSNLHREVNRTMAGVKLHVLRSDGGLATVQAAQDKPVALLMSGPAGGVTGAEARNLHPTGHGRRPWPCTTAMEK